MAVGILWLFFAMLWVGLQCVIVVFSYHTYLLLWSKFSQVIEQTQNLQICPLSSALSFTVNETITLAHCIIVVGICFNTYKPSVFFVGHWQTVHIRAPSTIS